MTIETYKNQDGETFFSKTNDDGETIYSFSQDFEDTWDQDAQNEHSEGITPEFSLETVTNHDAEPPEAFTSIRHWS